MAKRIVISCCALLLIGLVLFVFAKFINEQVTKGDVTNDGSINILDAYWTVLIILEIQLPDTSNMEEKMCAADVNGDGAINVLDVIRIVNKILDPVGDWFVSSCDELDCNDDNSCTQDYCDSLCIQCRHDNISSGTPCDDGDLCTINDVCVNGICVGTPKICDDGDPCTDDSCNPLTGECEYTLKSCDDSNPCTDDFCNPSTGECEYTYNSLPCDDGDPCTENDVCQNGSCQGTIIDLACGTVTDIDGIVYQTVQIGCQCWMAENLKVTHYRNGDPIPNVTSASEWAALTSGAYCNYNNDAENVAIYGRLYNWYAVDDSRNIAPTGWHVPTDAEWKQLEMSLGMSQSEANYTGWRGTNEGSKLAGNASLWASGDLENNPEFGTSGFTALPGGYRGSTGSFHSLGYSAYVWSVTEDSTYYAWHRRLGYGLAQVTRYSLNKGGGFSVRCVRD